MSYGEEKHPWSVFDGVKSISISGAPEPLMAEISAAIAALEYARASHSPPSSQHDARMADDKASMAADAVNTCAVAKNNKSSS